MRVAAGLEAGDLVIHIEDNGTGISGERVARIMAAADSGLEPGSAEGGLGMANVIARLRLFAGRRDVIDFRDAGPGASIVVRVPYREAF